MLMPAGGGDYFNYLTPWLLSGQGHFMAVARPTIWDISGTSGVAFSCDDNGRAARGSSRQLGSRSTERAKRW